MLKFSMTIHFEADTKSIDKRTIIYDINQK